MVLLNEWEHFSNELRDQINLTIIDYIDDLIIVKDYEKNRIAEIHKSVILENNYEIINDSFSVSKDIYKEWFINNRFEEFKSTMNERKKMLLENIASLLANKDKILESKRYRNVLVLNSFGGTSLSGPFDNSVITLGEIIKIWDAEPEFSEQCKCGGKSYVYSYGGSPLSGGTARNFKCIDCGVDYTKNGGKWMELKKIRDKYKYADYINYNFNVFKQTINKFSSKSNI